MVRCRPGIVTNSESGTVPDQRCTGIGHFPMVENYPEFRRYLLPELERMLAQK
jgi:hypothetical protein